MPIPPDTLRSVLERVEALCARRSPPDKSQGRLVVGVEGSTITITDERPPWHPSMGDRWTSQPVARLRYQGAAGEWSLQVPDGHRWTAYYGLGPTTSIEPQLAELDTDPTCVFWG